MPGGMTGGLLTSKHGLPRITGIDHNIVTKIQNILKAFFNQFSVNEVQVPDDVIKRMSVVGHVME